MSLSYVFYKNRNSEHCKNFKTIKNIILSAIDTLKKVYVKNSHIINYINLNQIFFQNYWIFEIAKVIYIGEGTIYVYEGRVIKLFAKQKKTLFKKSCSTTYYIFLHLLQI